MKREKAYIREKKKGRLKIEEKKNNAFHQKGEGGLFLRGGGGPKSREGEQTFLALSGGYHRKKPPVKSKRKKYWEGMGGEDPLTIGTFSQDKGCLLKKGKLKKKKRKVALQIGGSGLARARPCMGRFKSKEGWSLGKGPVPTKKGDLPKR